MSGFHNADITKGCLMGIGVSTLAVGLWDLKVYAHLILVPHMTKYHQFWRILFHPIAFGSSTELLVGLLSLSSAGTSVERAFGPRKFASFLLLSSALSTFITLLALIIGHRFGLNYIPSGPYGILFSLIWQRHRLVPAVYSMKVFGLELNSKTLSYVLVAQLALSDPPASLLAAFSGLLAGYLYNLDTPSLPPTPFTRRRLLRPLKSYRLPPSVYHLLGRLFQPVIGTSGAPRRSHRVLPGQSADAGGPMPAGLGSLFGAAAAARMGAERGSGPGVMNGVDGAASRAGGASGVARAGPGSFRRTAGQAGVGGDGGEETPRGAQGARAAMGEWVSELAGRSGTRAPTEDEIAVLSSMFPNISRERIVRALQRNDYNTAQAVEALLEENV